VTGPKFFAEALAEYEDAVVYDAVVYYERREEGLGARLIQEFDEAVALALGARSPLWKGPPRATGSAW